MKQTANRGASEAIEARVAEVENWRHRIHLPGGVVTPGSQDTQLQLSFVKLPADLSGRTVLDVGCSDGFFSFECEKRGAARVLAVDNFSSVYVDNPAGFHVARELLGSKVEFLQSDLFDLDPAALGRFDLVLFLGVLYHLRHPLRAIDHLAQFCGGQFILETELASPSGLWGKVKRRLVGPDDSAPRMRFIESTVVNRDPTTWWTPTPRCVRAMLRSAGFCAVHTSGIHHVRGAFHGFTPAHGQDAEELLASFGAQAVEKALVRRVPERSGQGDPLDRLRDLSIPQYAAVAQELAEERARRWHQEQRWGD